MSKSQSATEYLFIYGIAIIIIVSVAVIFFYSGLFSPGRYAPSNSVSGFYGFSVSQNCISGGALVMDIMNTNNYPVEITGINSTSSISTSLNVNQAFSVVLQSEQSQLFFMPFSCASTSGSRYASAVSIKYITGSEINVTQYSTGTITGASVQATPASVASFNGLNSYVESTGTGVNVNGTTALTEAVWFKPAFQTVTNGAYGSPLSEGSVCPDGAEALFVNSSITTTIEYTLFRTDQGNSCAPNNPSSISSPFGQWTFLVFVFNGTGGSLYGNGNFVAGNDPAGNSLDSLWAAANIVTIGGEPVSNIRYFKGEIANVQMYHSVLTASQISQLYSEGLGGAPLSNSGLFAWWPLDGNANDFSGNGNNGAATNVQWVSP